MNLKRNSVGYFLRKMSTNFHKKNVPLICRRLLKKCSPTLFINFPMNSLRNPFGYFLRNPSSTFPQKLIQELSPFPYTTKNFTTLRNFSRKICMNFSRNSNMNSTEIHSGISSKNLRKKYSQISPKILSKTSPRIIT